MTFVDPIGDMLTRIRNGQMRSLNKITIPFSVFRSKILEVLKKEGYIINFVIDKGEENKKLLLVDLKYYEGQPVIREIKRSSKPGRRVYSRATSIPRVHNGLGLAILSTSKGVMSDSEAIKNKGASLLLVGVKKVSGDFISNQPVKVVNNQGEEIAKGICSMSSDAIKIGINSKSTTTASPLVIHRDVLVLTSE